MFRITLNFYQDGRYRSTKTFTWTLLEFKARIQANLMQAPDLYLAECGSYDDSCWYPERQILFSTFRPLRTTAAARRLMLARHVFNFTASIISADTLTISEACNAANVKFYQRQVKSRCTIHLTSAARCREQRANERVAPSRNTSTRRQRQRSRGRICIMECNKTGHYSVLAAAFQPPMRRSTSPLPRSWPPFSPTHTYLNAPPKSRNTTCDNGYLGYRPSHKPARLYRVESVFTS